MEGGHVLQAGRQGPESGPARGGGAVHPDHHHPSVLCGVSGLDRKRLDRLHQLLEKERDPDTAAALKWAIFTLEEYLK